LLLLGCIRVFHAPLAQIGFNFRSLVIKQSAVALVTQALQIRLHSRFKPWGRVVSCVGFAASCSEWGDCWPKYLQIQSTFNVRKCLKDRLLIRVLRDRPLGALVTIDRARPSVLSVYMYHCGCHWSDFCEIWY